jgi:cell wall assembly regulator SMI1
LATENYSPLVRSLERVELWHQQYGVGSTDGRNSPPLLRPPASEADIDRLGQQLGRPVPDALQALLRLHDGGEPGDYPLPMRSTAPTSWRLLSAAEIASETERHQTIARELPHPVPVRAQGSVAAQWWGPGWIALGECGTGDLLCLDTAPPQGGASGQLVLYAHDAPERHVLYPGIAAWLGEAADDLENGRYSYERGVGLVPRDQPPGGAR